VDKTQQASGDHRTKQRGERSQPSERTNEPIANAAIRTHERNIFCACEAMAAFERTVTVSALLDLPLAVLLRTLSCVDARSLVRAALVNRELSAACFDEELWRALFLDNWGAPFAGPACWRSAFGARERLLATLLRPYRDPDSARVLLSEALDVLCSGPCLDKPHARMQEGLLTFLTSVQEMQPADLPSFFAPFSLLQRTEVQLPGFPQALPLRIIFGLLTRPILAARLQGLHAAGVWPAGGRPPGDSPRLRTARELRPGATAALLSGGWCGEVIHQGGGRVPVTVALTVNGAGVVRGWGNDALGRFSITGRVGGTLFGIARMHQLTLTVTYTSVGGLPAGAVEGAGMQTWVGAVYPLGLAGCWWTGPLHQPPAEDWVAAHEGADGAELFSPTRYGSFALCPYSGREVDVSC